MSHACRSALLCITLLSVLTPTPGVAADADLDLSFGANGVAATGFDLGDDDRDIGTRLLRTPSNQWWAVGLADVAGSGDHLAVSRRNADGTSIAVVDHAVGGASALADAELDGIARLHAAVTIAGTDGGVDAAVVRLQTNTSLDTAFGSGGIARVDLTGFTQETALAVELQADGRTLLLVGARNAGDTSISPIAVRLGTNGAIEAQVPILAGATGRPGSGVMKRLSDGRLLVGVTDTAGAFTACDLVLVMFAAGSFVNLDTSFGIGGLARRRIPDGGTCAELAALEVDSQGRFLLVGTRFGTSPVSEGVVVRLTASGQFDAAFSGDGFAPVPALLSSNVANAVAVQSDGRIVVAGTLTTTDGTISNVLLTRFNADGSLDASFGGNGPQRGYAIVGSGAQPSTRSLGSDVRVDEADRILVAGSRLWAAPADFDFALLRIKGTPRIFRDSFE
jgi:uncharacterized delta-60 repeat protein